MNKKFLDYFETYDYRNEMAEVIKDYIINELYDEIIDQLNDDYCYDDVHEFIMDNIEQFDITGNLSGSYTCNSFLASIYLLNNDDLFYDALEFFGYVDFNGNITIKADLLIEPEYKDVLIREYMLYEGQSFTDALYEIPIYIIVYSKDNEFDHVKYFNDYEIAKTEFENSTPDHYDECYELTFMKGNLYIDDEYEQLNNRYFEHGIETE